MMTLKELVEEAVRRGIAEVKTVGYKPNEERAAIAGFEKCLKLGSYEQYQAELKKCDEEKRRLCDAEDVGAYWEMVRYMGQVEHMYKLMCAAMIFNKVPGYETLPAPYMSGVRLYSLIVGVHGMDKRSVEKFWGF